MIGTNISFTREKKGYDREQVDSYIKKVSEAYQTTYLEYLDINGKYEKLLEERENSDSRELQGMNSEIAAKTLISTELLANKIITDAQTEAAAIIEEAQKAIAAAWEEADSAGEEAQRSIADAQAEAQRNINDSQAEAQRNVANAIAEAEAIITDARSIRDDAIAEAAGINKAANKVLDDALFEAETKASQIRTDIERAHMILQEALGEVEALLAYNVQEEVEMDYAAA